MYMYFLHKLSREHCSFWSAVSSLVIWTQSVTKSCRIFINSLYYFLGLSHWSGIAGVCHFTCRLMKTWKTGTCQTWKGSWQLAQANLNWKVQVTSIKLYINIGI
jgi:hypothetical protein